VLRPFLDAMPVLADPGYEGAGHGVHVPVKKPAGVKELDIDTRARNALLRSVRCLGERGRAIDPAEKPACHRGPGRISLIARAAFVLVFQDKTSREVVRRNVIWSIPSLTLIRSPSAHKIRTSGVSSIGLCVSDCHAAMVAAWDRCPTGGYYRVSCVLAAAKPLSPLRSALCARMRSLTSCRPATSGCREEAPCARSPRGGAGLPLPGVHPPAIHAITTPA
jgi:hypothetical protein